MVSKIILVVFLFQLCIAGQDWKPVHQSESEFYSSAKITFQKEIFNVTETNKENSTQKLNKTVFGYLPWWKYAVGSHKNIRLDLLTHIAIFSFETDSLGNLKKPLLWPWRDLIDSSHAKGIKLILTVTSFNPKDIHNIFTNSTVRNNLFDSIKNILIADKLDGVNIDFENLNDDDKITNTRNFLSDLRKYLTQIKAGYEISFASPIESWGKWDFSALAENCDYLFIMGYDFYGSWSNTTGPSSPLTGNTYSVTKSLEKNYAGLLSTSSEKLILGVPYYGNYWRTNSSNPYATVKPYDSLAVRNDWISSLQYNTIISKYDQKQKMWDNSSQTPWIVWHDSVWNQIWYDDDSSLTLKYDLAIRKNLKGIGIWALGYDDGRMELWKLIEKKFSTVVSVKTEIAELPTRFELYQNYPNPFNPTTTIKYSIPFVETGYIPSLQYVTLKVFDLLGREVVTLVNEDKSAGNYEIRFNAETLHATSLPSGIYFYRLQIGDFVETKKMVLMK